MKVLFEHELVTLTLDERDRLVRYVRTAVPAPSVLTAVATFDQCERAVRQLGRDDHALLCDVRVVPGNNDPDFEKGIASARARFFARFARVATLVQSATGLLQVQRLSRDAGERGLVFRDEAEALRYLKGP